MSVVLVDSFSLLQDVSEIVIVLAEDAFVVNWRVLASDGWLAR